MKKFKDGKRFDSNDKICKRRYSLIFVTAMQGVNMTAPAGTELKRNL
jgi:hypothetical protein